MTSKRFSRKRKISSKRFRLKSKKISRKRKFSSTNQKQWLKDWNILLEMAKGFNRGIEMNPKDIVKKLNKIDNKYDGTVTKPSRVVLNNEKIYLDAMFKGTLFSKTGTAKKYNKRVRSKKLSKKDPKIKKLLEKLNTKNKKAIMKNGIIYLLI